MLTLHVSIVGREERAKVCAHLEAAADTSMAAANFSPPGQRCSQGEVRESPPILSLCWARRFDGQRGLDARHTTTQSNKVRTKTGETYAQIRSGINHGCSDCDSGRGLFVRVKLHFRRCVRVERRIRCGVGSEGRGRDVCERDAAFESADDGHDYGSIAGQHRCGDADDPGGVEAAGDRDDQPVHVFAVAGVSLLLAGWADAVPD